MRVFINRRPVSGPWGGGNKTVKALVEMLESRGHEVTYTLCLDIDVLFCFDPRPAITFVLPGFNEMYEYAKRHKVPIIQRIGDLGFHSKPDLTELVFASAYRSDVVIFPSKWAYYYVKNQPGFLQKSNLQVIENAPAALFYEVRNSAPYSLDPKKIRFVTHHWSTNEKKGFKFYEEFDHVCNVLGHKFTYIGRLPDGLKLTNHVEPLSGIELAHELERHDMYVTASIEETGANHVLEAIAVGLPVIYHDQGGSIVEYCQNFGKPFNGSLQSFIEDALPALLNDYEQITESIMQYNNTLSHVVTQYVTIIEGYQKL